jgi:hypothetical protein
MSNATAKKLGEVLQAQGLHTIGALVFWTLSGVRIEREELKGALEDLDLGAAMVRTPKPATALAEAVKRVGIGKKGILFRPMKKEWALVVERGEGKALRLAHVATFRIGADERVEVEELARYDGTAELAKTIEAQFTEVIGYCHSTDLSAVLCSVMQGVGTDTMLGGLSLRQTAGGLYYVSAAKLDLLKRFAAMVNDKAPQSSIEVMTLTGDAENLDTAARNVRGNITSQLKQTREEIRDFVKGLKEEGRSARGDSIVVRAEQFKALRGRVELFADVLGDSMAELQAQIESARAELMAELEGA